MYGGKIPDGTDAAGYETVADRLGLVIGHGDDADAHIVIPAEAFQPVHWIDGLAAFRVADRWPDVKARQDAQPRFFKAAVIQQRLPQLARAHNDAGRGGDKI